MSKNIQHVVQFARNIDCFMQLKDTPRTGEADQLNLLKKGNSFISDKGNFRLTMSLPVVMNFF